MPADNLLFENPVLAEADGRTFDGYLSRPAEGAGPGLIIVTEMWGTTKLNRDMADKVLSGYIAAFLGILAGNEILRLLPLSIVMTLGFAGVVAIVIAKNRRKRRHCGYGNDLLAPWVWDRLVWFYTAYCLSYLALCAVWPGFPVVLIK